MNASSTGARKPFGRLLLTARPATSAASCAARSQTGPTSCASATSRRSATRPRMKKPASSTDRAAVMQLVDGVDAIVHLGGISVDAPFDDLVGANITGTYNLYEAARKHGVKRVVFASSNHAIGFHPVTEVLDADSPLRPTACTA